MFIPDSGPVRKCTWQGFESGLILTGSGSSLSEQTGSGSMIFSRPDPDPGKKPDPDEYFHLYYDYFQYEMVSFYIFWRSSFKFFPSKTFGAVSVHFCAKDPDPEKIENRLRIQAKITNSKPWHWPLAEFHGNFPWCQFLFALWLFFSPNLRVTDLAVYIHISGVQTLTPPIKRPAHTLTGQNFRTQNI